MVLSIKGNIKYDPKYKMVFVSSVKNINNLLENREDIISEKEVKKIIKKFKDLVTK